MAFHNAYTSNRRRGRRGGNSKDLVLPLWTLLLLVVVHAEQYINVLDTVLLDRCPPCSCSWILGKQTVDCQFRRLESIPKNLTNEAEVADFSNNDIEELQTGEFLKMQNLREIKMIKCWIQRLHRDTFKGLSVLSKLDMSNNFISILQPGTFEGLENLSILVMNKNQIEVLNNHLFDNLPFLSRVEFRNNELKRIEVHAFGRLPMLFAIDLEGNQLTVLSPEIFASTPNLQNLSLAANPWHCTCDLQEFRDFVFAHYLYIPNVKCLKPIHLLGKPWFEIPVEDFACQPRILEEGHQFIPMKSEYEVLRCQAMASPRPVVMWTYNGKTINERVHQSFGNCMRQSNMLTSELSIHRSELGLYKCVATNRLGEAVAEFTVYSSGAIGTASNPLLIIVQTTMALLLLVFK